LSLSSVFDQAPSGRPGVQKTPELARILCLPRRVLDLDKAAVDGRALLDLSPLYVLNPGHCNEYPSCPVCIATPVRLWPAQSAALLEAERAWGLFGPIAVGFGKTLITLLLPDALQSQRSVLLVPASVRNQLLTRDFASYGRHFKLPAGISVVSYEDLSSVKGANSLERLEPDLIIADEAHKLARYTAARTKRFCRYFKEHPGTRFCAVSGTVTRRSLRDYAHLCELSLRAGSPLPARWSDLQEWADALDPGNEPIPVGALRALADRRHLDGSDEERVAVRDGFRRRLVETSGVVATSESWEGASLVIAAVRPKTPPVVDTALALLYATWQIDGEEIEDPMRLAMVARQLASGFYYRWLWPEGVPDVEWLDKRAAWHQAVRQTLKRSKEGLDSPLLVARAAARGGLDEAAQAAWGAWGTVKDRYDPTPPTAVVWLHDFAVEAARAWAHVAVEPSIVWYSSVAVGEALGKHLPHYGPGEDAGEADPASQPVILCSIRAQGTGKNLQRYAANLVLEPPSSGAAWEQLLGRTHRPGQQADEVRFDVNMHVAELDRGMVGAVSDAIYVEETQGQRQKLLLARRIGW